MFASTYYFKLTPFLFSFHQTTMVKKQNLIYILVLFYCAQAQDCKNDYCYKTDSNLNETKLRGRENTYENENCYCHECEKFADCCNDLRKKGKTDFNRYKCNIKLNQNRGFIYSISSCDKKWPNDDIKENCERDFIKNKIINKIPVYSKVGNFTYKNVFCAKCNFEAINNLKPFELHVENELEDCLLENKTECNFSYTINDPIVTRRCFNAIDSCPENISIDNKELVKNCSEQVAYRFYFANESNLIYKNKYCAICNGVNESLLSCNLHVSRKLSFLQNMQFLFDLSDFNGNIHVGYKFSNVYGKCENQNKTVLDSLICPDSFDNENSNSIVTDNSSNINISIGESVKSYLTFIGNLISITSLLFLLGIYTLLKNLRNLAGKILMSLSASLLCAQLFFLLSNYISKEELELKLFKNVTLCYVFGLFTHYFFLVYFAWSNVMSFDLFKVLNIHSIRSSGSSTSNNTFLKYSLYAWILPFVVILILFIVRLSIDIQYQIYALNVCFLTYKTDLLIFFISPISVFLILNLLFFIISIISIRNVDKSSNLYLKKVDTAHTDDNTSSSLLSKTESGSKTQNSNSELKSCTSERKFFVEKSSQNKEKNKKNEFQRQRLVLFSKLFVLMGICWITSVVNSFYKDAFVWYIYIIVNSLQGFLIFLTIIFNRQTLKEIRQNRFLVCLTQCFQPKS